MNFIGGSRCCPRHLKVEFVGVRHWCRHLKSCLDRVDPAGSYRTLGVGSLLTARIRRPFVVRVGFRPGSTTARGLLFDLVWCVAIPRQRRVTYWVGTDVARTVAEAPIGRLRRRWMAYLAGRSACGAPWFVEELQSVGINAEYLRFPYGTRRPEWVPWPQRFVVSTYIPVNKPDFYGARVLEGIAQKTPDIEYRVYGGGEVKPLPNVIEMGHVDDFPRALSECVVHMRLTPHDAIAGTVRDALSLGRYVLFGYALPGVRVVSPNDPATVELELQTLLRVFDSGSLAPNFEGLRYSSTMSADADAAAIHGWLIAVAPDVTALVPEDSSSDIKH